MKQQYVYLICLMVCHVLPVIHAAHDSQYFKVPHDQQKRMNGDRPLRLVDKKSDPDMVKLKNIQEQFFTIISNTTLGTEFNGFSDILSLIDSGLGKQLGIIFASGVGIGFRKDNSFELLTEFWDEFQYRMPHALSDALIDYTDFAKSVDISLIPMTVDLLFQKDHMGNSLAQMPIGQLIDLVQPEASKYGIDIRSFVNGILGKGDSTFPDLVRNSLLNANLQTVIQTLSDFVPIDILPNRMSFQDSGVSGLTRQDQLEKTLHLFKPLIANLLKNNHIDLEADAVIQVLLPFVGGASEYVTNIFGNGGQGFQLSMLAPLFAMLKGANIDKDNPLGLLADVMGNIAMDDDKGLSNIIKLASQFIGKAEEQSGSKQSGEGGLDFSSLQKIAGRFIGSGGGIDANSLISTAASFLSNSKDGPSGAADIMGMIGKLSKGESIETAQILETAASLMQNLQSPKQNDQTEKKSDRNNKLLEKKEVKPMENVGFIKAVTPIITLLKSDKKLQEKIKVGIKQIKKFLQAKKISTSNLESFLLSISGLKKLPQNVDINLINSVFSYSYPQWRDVLSKLGDQKMRTKIISQVTTPAAQVVSMIGANDFDKQIHDTFTSISTSLEMYGIKDLTLDNFPEKLQAPLQMLSMVYGVPLDLTHLLLSLKSFLNNLIAWKEQATNYIRRMPKQELASAVSKSLDKDVVLPLFEVWKAYEKTITYPDCLPRSMCDVVTKMEAEPSPSSLKIATARLSSFAFGVSTAYYTNQDFELIADLFLTSFSRFEDCQESFPVACPDFDDDIQESKSDYHQRMHEDL